MQYILTITNEAMQPISGALVQLGNNSYISDNMGTVYVDTGSLPADAVVTISASNYADFVTRVDQLYNGNFALLKKQSVWPTAFKLGGVLLLAWWLIHQANKE